MTWFKVDDQFHGHPKVLELRKFGSKVFAEAVALWTLAGSWSSLHLTDGYVPEHVAKTLVPYSPTRAIDALVEVGLFSSRDRFGSWDEWQPTKSQVLAERSAARKRMEKRRGSPSCSPEHPPNNARTEPEHPPNFARSSPVGSPDVRLPRPDPSRPKEDPPLPPLREPVPIRPRLRDPMISSRDRADVQELFVAYKTHLRRPNAKLGLGAYSVDADRLAEAIDTHGLEACLLVAKHASQDGMVSGKHDDKGRKHESIAYIFGNADAFHRILAAAEEREGKTSVRRSAAELYAEARKL